MKICMYGGTANNLYIISKILKENGFDIVFIRDTEDSFMFSQPSWQDVREKISYGEIYQKKRISEILLKEKSLNWKMPNWFINPDSDLGYSDKIKFGNGTFLEKQFMFLLMFLFKRKKRYSNIIQIMQSCDLVITCGLMPMVLGYLSGRKNFMWPSSGEIRFALGIDKPHPKNILEQIYLKMMKNLSNKAFKQLLGAVNCDGVRSRLPLDNKLLSDPIFIRIPYPMNVLNKKIATDEKRILRKKVFQELDIENKFWEKIIFIPSRVDFYWKGHDILFEALKKIGNTKKICFLFAGWGKDFSKIKEEFESFENIIALSFSVSKPILYDLFKSVDLVIDQFVLGSYGTSSMEAMSVGTPVMIKINTKYYQKVGWDSPPVYNCKNANEIYEVLNNIQNGKIDLEAKALETLEWMQNRHSYNHFLESFNNFIKTIRI